jgi:uncharacterized lipoprotein YajG
MRVVVEIHFNDKNYSLDREREDHWPGSKENIVEFVTATLEEVIADITRLEDNE